MSRFDHYHHDFVSQSLILAQRFRLSVLCAVAFALFPNATAQAGSVSASLQIRAQVVSSCLVSANALQSTGDTTQGSFNCQTTSASSTSTNAVARGESANYTLSDAPGTDGAVKILTINF